MQEIWKDIIGYEQRYQVSNIGNVRSMNFNKTGKVRNLTKFKDRYGYYYVSLPYNGKSKKLKVHRLVASGFLGLDIFEKKENYHGTMVCHKDDNPNNNIVDNLFLGTAKDNIQDMIRKGRGVFAKGERSKSSKKILQYTTDGVLIREWGSQKCIERDMGIKQALISGACIRGKKGLKGTCKGFIWRFS